MDKLDTLILVIVGLELYFSVAFILIIKGMKEADEVSRKAKQF